MYLITKSACICTRTFAGLIGCKVILEILTRFIFQHYNAKRFFIVEETAVGNMILFIFGIRKIGLKGVVFSYDERCE